MNTIIFFLGYAIQCQYDEKIKLFVYSVDWRVGSRHEYEHPVNDLINWLNINHIQPHEAYNLLETFKKILPFNLK